ncbi:MAG: phage integrase N-terminal SAM-like domain-containing protein, partial [Steroidobacter sp.]
MQRQPLKSTRLFDQLRERIRYAHYSTRTEKTCVYWARFYIRFHKLRHPKDLGHGDVSTTMIYTHVLNSSVASTPQSI